MTTGMAMAWKRQHRDGMGKQQPTDSSSNMDAKQLYKNDGIE